MPLKQRNSTIKFMMFSGCIVRCEKNIHKNKSLDVKKIKSVAGADPYGKLGRRKAPDYLILRFRLHCEYGKTLLVDL